MMRGLLDVRTQQQKLLAGPPCEKCGGVTRLVRIEPHKRLKRRHIWALECLSCGTEQVADMPAPQRVH
jgi:hypothetical protein